MSVLARNMITLSRVDDGAKGATGATGVGISTVVEEYYLSTSKTTQSGGTWSTTMPTWVSGKYIWQRQKITYTNSTTKYTTAYLANGINSANETANTAKEATDTLNTLIRETTDGVEVARVDSTGAYTGMRTEQTADAYVIKDKDGTELASYGADTVKLGEGNSSAVIDMCDGATKISYDNTQAQPRSEILFPQGFGKIGSLGQQSNTNKTMITTTLDEGTDGGYDAELDIVTFLKSAITSKGSGTSRISLYTREGGSGYNSEIEIESQKMDLSLDEFLINGDSENYFKVDGDGSVNVGGTISAFGAITSNNYLNGTALKLGNTSLSEAQLIELLNGGILPEDYATKEDLENYVPITDNNTKALNNGLFLSTKCFQHQFGVNTATLAADGWRSFTTTNINVTADKLASSDNFLVLLNVTILGKGTGKAIVRWWDAARNAEYAENGAMISRSSIYMDGATYSTFNVAFLWWPGYTPYAFKGWPQVHGSNSFTVHSAKVCIFRCGNNFQNA